jgi:hypothetical protein
MLYINAVNCHIAICALTDVMPTCPYHLMSLSSGYSESIRFGKSRFAPPGLMAQSALLWDRIKIDLAKGLRSHTNIEVAES